jgi:ParB-like chromosome segregation protein Spo0J
MGLEAIYAANPADVAAPGGIEWRPIAALTHAAHNSRTHSGEQVIEIALAMEQWGWTMPALIDEADELIAGHGRTMAAELIYAGFRVPGPDGGVIHPPGVIRMASGGGVPVGYIPVIVARGWSEAQKRAYLIADNRIGDNAGWDEAMLRLELSDLRDTGFDLGLIGFDADALRELSVGVEALSDMPVLNDGDRSPFREMTFVLLAAQAETVERAVQAAAQLLGPVPDKPNKNHNGNALAEICQAYLDKIAEDLR